MEIRKGHRWHKAVLNANPAAHQAPGSMAGRKAVETLAMDRRRRSRHESRIGVDVERDVATEVVQGPHPNC